MSTMQGLIDEVYLACGTTSALSSNRITPTTIAKAMNNGMHALEGAIRRIAPTLFVTSITADLTRDTAYALPDTCITFYDVETKDGHKLRKIDYSGSDTLRPSLPSTARVAYIDSGYVRPTGGGYEVRGRDIILRDADLQDATIRYLAGWSDIHYGTASAGAASTITLDASTPIPSVLGDNDVYNGMRIVTYGGAGSGQSRFISDYDGSTKVATVSNAWTTTPDNTTTYSIMPPWPSHVDEVLVYEALKRLDEEKFAAMAVNRPTHQDLVAAVIAWAEDFKRQGAADHSGLDKHRDATVI